MVAEGGPTLPVVHIRVVCEQKSVLYPCDFCLKNFTQESSLSHHISTDHKSIDVREVYLCPICSSCVLDKNDLLEHTALRHQIEVANGSCQSKLCEYCGIQVSDLDCLKNHIETHHLEDSHVKGMQFHSITELTMNDVSLMGMGDDQCRTIFRVFEIPFRQKCEDSVLVNHSSKGKQNCLDLKRSIEKENSLEITKLDHCEVDIQCSSRLNVEESHESKDESQISFDKYNNDSEIDMTIHCEPNDLSLPSSIAELAITVESNAEVEVENDVSEAEHSYGVIRKADACDRSPTIVVEKLKNDSDNITEPCRTLKPDEEEPEGEVQPFDIFVENQITMEQAKSSMVQPSEEYKTYVVVNCADQNRAVAAGADGQKQVQKLRKCCICEMRFSNMVSLESHESTAHGVRIKCDLCDDTFASSKSLKTHYLRKHSKSKKFLCELCERQFKSNSNLWSHRLTHNESARKYKCTQCTQCFYSKTKLNTHLQTHSGKKKYQCGECPKGFPYPGLLVNHMSKHLSEERWDTSENEIFYLVEVGNEEEPTSTSSLQQ